MAAGMICTILDVTPEIFETYNAEEKEKAYTSLKSFGKRLDEYGLSLIIGFKDEMWTKKKALKALEHFPSYLRIDGDGNCCIDTNIGPKDHVALEALLWLLRNHPEYKDPT